MTIERDMVDAILRDRESNYQSILDLYAHSIHQMSYQAQDIYYAVMGIVSINKYIHISEMIRSDVVGCNDITLRRKRLNRMCDAYLRGGIL